MHVVVIGGGLIGMTSAWYLLAAGHEVTLVERHDGLAEETSFANAGLVTPSQAEPWNPPGTLARLMRHLGREDSPLLLRPSALPGLAAWGLKFLRNARPEAFERNVAANTRLAAYSLAQQRRLQAELDLPYDRQARGTLRIVASQRDLDHAAAHIRALESFGLPATILDRRGLVALEPALAPTAERLAGGIHFPDDETGDAHLFTRALGERVAARGGMIRLATTVQGFDTDGDRIAALQTDRGPIRGDAFVLAAGSLAPALARPLGMRLPIYPVKGYSATVPVEGWNAAPRLAVIDEKLMVAATPLGTRLRIGGTAEFAGFDRTLNQRRAQAVLHTALRLYPGLAPYADAARFWTGLRPMTPDGRPIIGRSRWRNLFVNAGHGSLGWTMACGSGRLLADLIAARSPEIDPDPYNFRNFN